MKQIIRLTESDLHRIVKESVKRVIKEDLTNKQIRNITGIYDDDELNASVEAEEKEELESDIWKLMASLAGGNPRKQPFDFNEFARLLKSKYGFIYKGNDDNNECHIFSNGKGELVIYPTTYYPRMGKLRIYNMHYN